MFRSKKRNSFTRTDVTILVGILLVALFTRLYNFNTPLADWHSWRQADTAAVARNFEREGFDLLNPKYDDLSSAQTGQLNPQGIRLVEFPLYNAAVAATDMALPFLNLVQSGRLLTIIFSLIVMSCIYYIARVEIDRTAAFWTGILYATFPFFVYYSRVVLPESMALASVFIALILLYKYEGSKSRTQQFIWLFISALFAAIALLVKPTAIFYFLALGFVFLRKHSLSIIRRPEIYLYFIIAFIPFLLWRYRISLSEIGAPPSLWLLTTVNTFEGPQRIFMRPAFFRWIFHERILLLIFGGWSGAFLLLGTLRKLKRPLIPVGIGLSALIYLLTFQGGNVQHDYYQTITFPALALFAGSGIGMLYTQKKVFRNKLLVTFVVIGTLGFSMFTSFQTVKGYYGFSEELINTAEVLRTITPKDALISTDTLGDTTLLFNADRKGFPVKSGTLPELKEQGMEYFVTNVDVTAEQIIEEYTNEFELIFKSDNVHIFKL